MQCSCSSCPVFESVSPSTLGEGVRGGVSVSGSGVNSQKSPIPCVHYNAADNTGNPEVADSNADVFAPTTNNVGFPQSRCITDKTGQWTLVSTSEYAKYAHYYLPHEVIDDAIVYGTFKGSVRGVLGFYMDNAAYSPGQDSWAITICDLGDLDLKKEDGTKWVPVEWVK